jgi:hypothetical protein
MAEESSPARGAGGIQQQLDSVEKVLKVALQLRSIYQIGNYQQGEFIVNRNSADLQNNFSRTPKRHYFCKSENRNSILTTLFNPNIIWRIYLFAGKEKWFLQPPIL